MGRKVIKQSLSPLALATTARKADVAVEEAKTATMPPRVGRGKAKAEAAVEEEPAAKKAATMPPKGVGKGKEKADAAEPAVKTAATMPPKGVGKGKEKADAAEPAVKMAATMPPKGGPGYLQLALDALETLGTATLPKITKWIESERPEVDFKPHLLKAALKKAVEKGAPPHCHRSARARGPRRRGIACRGTSASVATEAPVCTTVPAGAPTATGTCDPKTFGSSCAAPLTPLVFSQAPSNRTRPHTRCWTTVSWTLASPLPVAMPSSPVAHT